MSHIAADAAPRWVPAFAGMTNWGKLAPACFPNRDPMMPTPREAPKAALVCFIFASLLSLSALLPDAIQGPAFIGLVLLFIFAFNHFLRRS